MAVVPTLATAETGHYEDQDEHSVGPGRAQDEPSGTTGLFSGLAGGESSVVMHLTTQLAVTFLDTVLDKKEGVRFKRYLSPKWPMHHEDHIYSAESFAGWGDICPTDQNVGCADD